MFLFRGPTSVKNEVKIIVNWIVYNEKYEKVY